jgi:hypothetical protein
MSAAAMAAAAEPWPPRSAVDRCFLVWSASTPAQRQELTSVEGDEAVLYLRVTDAVLTLKTQQACGCDDTEGRAAAVAAARAACCLQGAEYKMERPRRAALALAFCEQDASFEGLLACAAQDEAEADRILKSAASGRLAMEGGETTVSWGAHERDFFTLALAALVRRSVFSDAALLENLCSLLRRPAPRALRSWPSKKAFAELKDLWSQLAFRERVELTALGGGMIWFVQACDLAVALQVLRHCARAGSEEAVRSVLDRGRRAVRLDCVMGTEDRVLLADAFVAEPGCLEHLQRHALQQLDAKDALVRAASEATPQTIVSAQSLALSGAECFGWEDAARVVFTLILEALLQRCALLRRIRSRAQQHRQRQAEEEQAQAQAGARHRQEKKRRAAAAKAAAKVAKTIAAEAEAEAAMADESEPESEARPSAPPPPPLSPLSWAPVSWRLRATFVEVEEDEDEQVARGRRWRACSAPALSRAP